MFIGSVHLRLGRFDRSYLTAAVIIFLGGLVRFALAEHRRILPAMAPAPTKWSGLIAPISRRATTRGAVVVA
jgi:hypothetical protein